MGQPDKRYEAELLIALERAIKRMDAMAIVLNEHPVLDSEGGFTIFVLYDNAGAWLRKVNNDRDKEGNEDPSKTKP